MPMVRFVIIHPFYPPSVADGNYLYIQIHGRKARSNVYGSGLREFPSKACHKKYAKDLLLWQRIVCRKLVVDRSKLDEHWLKSCSSPFKVSPEFGMNGTFLDSALQEEAFPAMKSILGKLHGPFAARIANQMFAEVTILTTPHAFRIRGKYWGLGAAGVTVPLDGKSHPFVSPFPLEHLKFILGRDQQMVGTFNRTANPNGDLVGSVIIVIDAGIQINKEWISNLVPKFAEKISQKVYKLVQIKQFSKISNSMQLTHFDYLFPLDFQADINLTFDVWMNDPVLSNHLAFVEQDLFHKI